MKRRGTGVGCMFYGVGNTGLPNPAAAFVQVLGDTSVHVTVGAADIGQGSSTMAASVAAETLGLNYEDIHVVWADTMYAPEGGATSASAWRARQAACSSGVWKYSWVGAAVWVSGFGSAFWG